MTPAKILSSVGNEHVSMQSKEGGYMLIFSNGKIRRTRFVRADRIGHLTLGAWVSRARQLIHAANQQEPQAQKS